jgi:transposase-like protein
VEIKRPRDRRGTFEPKIVRKRQRRFEGFNEKILALSGYSPNPVHRVRRAEAARRQAFERQVT